MGSRPMSEKVKLILVRKKTEESHTLTISGIWSGIKIKDGYKEIE